ncbi:SagB/ThcOx family dehydrogenase [Candidatus Latescibacterota bacterium]
MKRYSKVLVSFTLITLLLVPVAISQDLKLITLPEPQTDIGMPLMQALQLRKSIREYSTKELPPQELSNLLWAGWGINRPDGHRTAPSTSNMQEIDVFVVLEEGAYRYNPQENTLEPIVSGDIRAATGRGFAATAPLTLVFVADFTKMRGDDRNRKITTSSVDTGFISQNVYLYCASQGLATVVRGSVNRDECAKALNLGPDQYVTYAQSVGYPN